VQVLKVPVEVKTAEADETVTDIVDESMAEIEYAALQNEWFETTMELPKVFVERLSGNGA